MCVGSMDIFSLLSLTLSLLGGVFVVVVACVQDVDYQKINKIKERKKKRRNERKSPSCPSFEFVT